ncbi:hypothetical protein GCM10022197_22120 [Microlunatus spumicola]|uniref:Secreted protein n=1 Tax=Microlunatus spumicola TaxID=81499 RepID=A0ABP6XGN8_9ACTN
MTSLVAVMVTFWPAFTFVVCRPGRTRPPLTCTFTTTASVSAVGLGLPGLVGVGEVSGVLGVLDVDGAVLAAGADEVAGGDAGVLLVPQAASGTASTLSRTGRRAVLKEARIGGLSGLRS